MVDKTAGTVAIANGATSVTGTSTAFAAGDKRSYIQFEGGTNWYEVTAVSGQTLTIDPSFAETTLTAGTYKLRQIYYGLASDSFKVFDVRQSNTPRKLTRMGIFTFDSYQPDVQTTGQPTAYYLFRYNPDTAATSAKQYQIGLFPIADDEYNIEYRYMLNQDDLSADGDIPYLPVPYHSVLVDGAEWLGSKFLNDPKEAELKQQYEFNLEKLIERESAHGDWMPVLGSSDAQPTSRFLPFPTSYEQPT